MIINCNGLPGTLQQGVLILAEQGFLMVGEEGRIIKALQGNEIKIVKTESEIVITYDSEPHFYMALARSIGMQEGTQVIEQKVDNLGFMLDCSRNAVPKPEMVKRLIGLLVLMGYEYLELYTEDTYELPGEPYFGYKRGRYSRAELEEFISFAECFRMEMVPCIQTLAHLKNLTYWGDYHDIFDIDDILLVGHEKTYNLIRKCVRYCKEVFHTNRINIGADEAFNLGLGKYAKLHGFCSKHEIYKEHLKKVFDICKEEGMQPEFWGDAFYHTDAPVEDIQSIFDGEQTPIYWNYDIYDKEKHCDIMTRFQQYAGKMIYAGGLRKWSMLAPDNGYTEEALDLAFEAATECGVKHILITTWGDNGSECSVYTTIPSMWYAAHQLFPCCVDEDTILHYLTGYTRDEWKVCDRINYVVPRVGNQMSDAGKYMLYNDYLIGLMDYHTPDFAGEVFAELHRIYDEFAKRDSQFSYLFDTYAALSKALIRKATYGKRLRDAYQKNDKETIGSLVEELTFIREDLHEFYTTFRNLWMKENKGYGFEVSDVRIGGLIARIETVTIMLRDYLEGRIDKIYELEDESLDYWCGATSEELRYARGHTHWATLVTTNHIW